MTDDTNAKEAALTPQVQAIVSRDVDRTYGEGVSIELKPGMAWALYADDGPGGPCGQSCRTTCPHSVLAVWPNEDAMRAAMANGFGRNRKARLMMGVVDDWTSGGNFRVMVYG